MMTSVCFLMMLMVKVKMVKKTKRDEKKKWIMMKGVNKARGGKG